MSRPGEAIARQPVFYKYVTAETALKILQTGTVRYSSPLSFNDPFDIQSGLHFPFEVGTLSTRALERIKAMVESDIRPPVNENDEWGQAILLAWSHRDRRSLPDSLLRAILDDLCDRIVLYQRQCQAFWQTFLSRMRVFCVTEQPDNVLLWSHYALRHTGAVLGFNVMRQEDNALVEARPIVYRPAPPALFTEEQWLGSILGTEELDPRRDIFLDYAYIKSSAWDYEREWRVWTIDPGAPPTLYTDYALLPGELAAVYFGCKIDLAIKQQLHDLVAERYPTATLYQASRPIDEYRLHFASL